MDFVTSHFGKMMFWLEENLIFSNVLIRGESNFDDKYVEKSVQLVIGSSFRNDLLQNPYFRCSSRLSDLTSFLYKKVRVYSKAFLSVSPKEGI